MIRHYLRVEIAPTVTGLGRKCGRVFICTGTMEVKGVLTELAGCLQPDAHVIITTGNIDIESAETVFKGKITKIMPTQLCKVGEGVTLVCHNDRVLPRDREFIRSAFGLIGKVQEIEETQFDLAGDLCSCAPAFFASIMNNLAVAARHHGSFTDVELKEMIVRTCYGTCKLLMEGNVSFADLITRVATRGGISEGGVRVLDARLPAAFDELLTTTLTKRQTVQKRTREQYDRQL